MPRKLDLRNKQFGYLTALYDTGKRNISNSIIWMCKCKCGNFTEVPVSSLTTNKTRSCGCLNKEKSTTHSHYINNKPTPTYISWQHMKDRCSNKNHVNFDSYGGRGIKVCSRWNHSFENFLVDMGERPKGTSLDRINNNGNYEPGNCRWINQRKQIYNSSTSKLTESKVKEIRYLIKNSDLNQIEISKIFNISAATISMIKNNKIWKDIR